MSMQGATCLVMFTGIMNAVRYGKILESNLVPFIKTYFPDGHQLQQDSDPKHASKYIGHLFKFHNVYWLKTPAESLDLNPIKHFWESLWESLEQYLRNSFKPTNLQELLDNIEQFWLSLTPEICTKYTVHTTPAQGHT